MNVTKHCRIDPEFQALIPPLLPQEFVQLEENLLRNGCRDALVTWRGLLLDGHNRFAICTKHQLPMRTIDVPAPVADRTEAKIWIVNNQAGRRNLSDDQRACMGVDLEDLLIEQSRHERAKKAVTERERKHGRRLGILVGDAPTKIKGQSAQSRQRAAKMARVTEQKLRLARWLKKENAKLFLQVKIGQLSLADAVRETRRTGQLERLESIEAMEAKQLSGIFDVIVVDPPWPIEKIERDVHPHQAEMDYPTMDEQQLRDLGRALPAAEHCHLWLWTTHRFLPLAFDLLAGWGWKYVCTFVWHKAGGFQPINLPQYNCEFALYARKGSPHFVSTKDFKVCFDAPRGAHSVKPDLFYEMVRRVTAGRRMDYFNRRLIEGFEGFGKESPDESSQ